MGENTKNIVVWGVGDIAQATALQVLENELAKGNGDIKLHFISRESEKAKNRGLGLAMDWSQGLTAKYAKNPKVNIPEILGIGEYAEGRHVVDKGEDSEPEIGKLLAGSSIIITGNGVPRKGNQDRSEVLDANGPIPERECTIIGKYAPKEVPVLGFANPADALLQIGARARKEGYEEAHPGEKFDDFSANMIFMSTELDSTRPSIFASEELKKALEEKGISIDRKMENMLNPANISFFTGGEHGNNQVIDLQGASIVKDNTRAFIGKLVAKIDPDRGNKIIESASISLEQFCKDNGVDYGKISEAIVDRSKKAGSEIIAQKEKSITVGAAIHVAGLVDKILSNKESVVGASAVRQYPGDDREIASGGLVRVGNGKIIGEVPYPETILENEKANAAMIKGRDATNVDVDNYWKNNIRYNAKNDLREFLGANDNLEVAKDSAVYSVQFPAGESVEVARKFADDLAVVSDILPRRIKVIPDVKGTKVEIPAGVDHGNGKSADTTLDKIFADANIEVQAKSNSRGR